MNHRRRLIAEALASPPPPPAWCEQREVLHGIYLRVPPSDYITRSHIRRAHEVARGQCGGATNGLDYEAHLQAEYSRLTDAEPWYWNQLWPGGIALARHVLAHPMLVRGCSVLEFGTGLGLLALSAAHAGASHVVATDIEPTALAFVEQSAADSHIADGTLATIAWDWQAPPAPNGAVARSAPFDVVFLPDVLYDEAAVERLGALAPSLVAPGGLLLLADGTDRPYGRAHTERLLVLLQLHDASTPFEVLEEIEVIAGAEAEDGGAAPERPVRLLSLRKGHPHGTPCEGIDAHPRQRPLHELSHQGSLESHLGSRVDATGLVACHWDARHSSSWCFVPALNAITTRVRPKCIGGFEQTSAASNRVSK